MKTLVTFFFLCSFIFQSWATDEPKTLEIGSKAPDFKLQGINNKYYNLASFAKSKVLVIIFTSNHCPTAQAYEDRIMKITEDYKSKGVQVVGINPNSDVSVANGELAWTDINDSFNDMKIRAKDKKFNFPYLYDGITQATTTKYGAVATPHVFVFDQKRILQYQGRIDNDEHIGKHTTHELTDAIDAVLLGTKPVITSTKVFGCSIKWLSKVEWKKMQMDQWNAETATLENANIDTLKSIMANKDSGKYRLVNLWATWCGPCVAEFDDIVMIGKIYRNRDFELVTISLDEVKNKGKALAFLNKKHASNKNYIVTTSNKYDLMEIIDPNWQGAIPYTLLIDPNGKVLYRKMGMIDPLTVKKNIVDNLGRYFD